MSVSRDELERALLTNPFSAELRAQYAQLLLEQGEAETALDQFELILKQTPTDAAAQVGAALSLLGLGRESEALQRYAAARNAPGFESDPTLDARMEKAKPAQPVRLSVVQGGRADNVTTLTLPPTRERIRFVDIAGLEDLKRTVRLQIIEPFLKPGIFAKFKKRAGGGVLLYGPPG